MYRRGAVPTACLGMALLFFASCGNPVEVLDTQAGLDRSAVQALAADIQRGDYGDVRSLVLAHGRDPAIEYTFRGARSDDVMPVYSITKSVTAVLTGIAIDRGSIGSEHVPLAQLLPAHASAFTSDSLRAALTVHDLLTMRAGFEWNEFAAPYGAAGNPFTAMLESPDWIAHMLQRRMLHAPGVRYAYNSGASVLVGAALSAATNESVARYSRHTLFEPLRITTQTWQVGPVGAVNTGSGLSLRPRDLMAFGRMVRDTGRVEGRQVVSAGWIAQMLTPVSNAPLGARYGRHWWLLGPDGAYDAAHPIAVALGWGGQVLAIDRTTGVVLVVSSRNFDQDALVFAQSIVRRLPRLHRASR